jgi:SOS-response transcriptional repressor LexA
MSGAVPAPPRRWEALAYIVDRIQRSGTCPSYGEIGQAMRPRVEPTRVRQLIEQLVKLELIERPIASRRGIRIRDLAACRRSIEAALGREGWSYSQPLGTLEPPPCTFEQLMLLPLIVKDTVRD